MLTGTVTNAVSTRTTSSWPISSSDWFGFEFSGGLDFEVEPLGGVASTRLLRSWANAIDNCAAQSKRKTRQSVMARLIGSAFRTQTLISLYRERFLRSRFST